MEDKQSSSKRKLLSIIEKKSNKYKKSENTTQRPENRTGKIDLEIVQNRPLHNKRASNKILVTVKPRNPRIKTLYIAEKARFNSKKNCERLGIGDHSSFPTTRLSSCLKNGCTVTTSATESTNSYNTKKEYAEVDTPANECIESSRSSVQCIQSDSSYVNTNQYKRKKKLTKICPLVQSVISPKYTENRLDPRLQDKSTIADTGLTTGVDHKKYNHILKRIACLENIILRQEMVFQALDQKSSSSSTEVCDNEDTSGGRRACRAGCSYVEQYSHVPQTSAFQRQRARPAAPLSPSKATTIEKEHNSEQYSRDFTTYDGITTRGRRQCASVPCKRDDAPRIAHDRVNKIRHKLNPVRDYRLMDTVHYLAQGEFAPRDDGIKLTPSREAVLSDIIWEDVFRTHWPNVRLGRRGHPERYSARWELQRLIDSLLRERVAHVERRRRRHYRIVKLNQRHESCRPFGKTGDVIVAKHHDREETGSDHNHSPAPIGHKVHRGHEGSSSHDNDRRRSRADDSIPGTSYSYKAPTCCYRSTNREHTITPTFDSNNLGRVASATSKHKNPRLLVKRENSRRKYTKEEGLEQFILLPTLVVKTASNIKRQKKFNELYHRIWNVNLQTERASKSPESDNALETEEKEKSHNCRKDVGSKFSTNSSDSEDN